MGWCSCSCQLAAQAKYAPKLRTGHYLQTQSPVQCSWMRRPRTSRTHSRNDGRGGWVVVRPAARTRLPFLQSGSGPVHSPTHPSLLPASHTLHSDATHKLRCVCVAQAQARPAVQFSRFGRKNAYACTTKTHRPPQFGVVIQCSVPSGHQKE